MHNKLTLF